MSGREEAVASEVIGFVLLVAVFVVIAGFIAITMVSDSGNKQAPAVVISSGAYYDGDQLKLILRNDGGDFLDKDKLRIFVEGEDVTAQFVNNDDSSDWDKWDTGEEIFLDVPEKPDDIQIISYQNNEKPSVIYLLGDDAGKPIVVPTTIPTATPTVGPDQPPVSDFKATPLSGGAPLVVNFTDESMNSPSSWQWDFGDGTTSTDQNPTHIYSSFGTFTVTLTAGNNHGSNAKTKTAYITVVPSQSCEVSGLTGYYYRSNDFTGTPVTRIDQRIRFADQAAIDDSRYDYGSDIADWPNPIIGRDEQFSVIYEGYLMIDKEADYTFYLTSDDGSKLWIDNTGESDTPVVDNWDDHSPEEKSNQKYLTVGFHPLKIKMYEKTVHAVLQLEWESSEFDRKFVDSFCTDECCKPLNAEFTAEPQTGSVPLNVNFTDLSTGILTSWLWDFGDGSNSTVQNPSHIYSVPGNYSVTLTVTDIYGSSDSFTSGVMATEPSVCARPGLTGFYFTNINYAGTPEVRSDLRIRFADDKGVSRYDEGTDIDNWPEDIIGTMNRFSVIYEGYIIVEEAGDYTFYLTSDDGSYLWVDDIDDSDTPLIDNGGYHAPRERLSPPKYLDSGCHPVKVKMFENSGAAVLHLEWSSDEIARTFNIPFCRDDVCPSGPVPAAWWKFDEASGGIATDSSGNDNDGSIKGTYSRVAGACGDGLYFDGTSTYVLVPDDDSLDAPKYLTYAAWLKPEPPVNPYGMVHRYLNFTSLICKGSQDEDNYELFIRDLDGTSKFSFETYSGSYKEYSTTGFGYEYGQWQHVAFVADTDSGAAKLYINGEYAATVTSSLPDSFATNNNALTIGVQQMYSPYFFRYKGVMDEVILYTIALTDDQVREVYGKCTPSSGPGAPVAGFSVDTTSGNAPLTVTFTDTSANSPTSWLWNFGDGTTSTEQNPSHTYDDAGTYSVTLTTTNTGGTDTVTKTDYIDVSGVEISDFARFVVDEGVFVYGEKLEFNGDSINGPGSTVIITNDLKADKINGGASLLASNIYVGNTIDMDKGGADIGSQRNPGIIYAGNDMKLLQGSRNIYGRVHVKNNFELKDARIHNNVYVGGDLKLEHEPWIADDAYIYYVGKIDSPKNFPQSILDKCIKVDSVPEISMPEYSIPNARQASWYSSHGYDFDDGDKILSSGIKILSDGNYERKRGNSDDPRNIIIVSKDGDIKLENYNKPVSGILFAPKGKVTFKGDLFEGLVIAKDGFYVEQGGTDITFKNMDQFITNPADYPF